MKHLSSPQGFHNFFLQLRSGGLDVRVRHVRPIQFLTLLPRIALAAASQYSNKQMKAGIFMPFLNLSWSHDSGCTLPQVANLAKEFVLVSNQFFYALKPSFDNLIHWLSAAHLSGKHKKPRIEMYWGVVLRSCFSHPTVAKHTFTNETMLGPNSHKQKSLQGLCLFTAWRRNTITILSN